MSEQRKVLLTISGKRVVAKEWKPDGINELQRWHTEKLVYRVLPLLREIAKRTAQMRRAASPYPPTMLHSGDVHRGYRVPEIPLCAIADICNAGEREGNSFQDLLEEILENIRTPR